MKRIIFIAFAGFHLFLFAGTWNQVLGGFPCSSTEYCSKDSSEVNTTGLWNSYSWVADSLDFIFNENGLFWGASTGLDLYDAPTGKNIFFSLWYGFVLCPSLDSAYCANEFDVLMDTTCARTDSIWIQRTNKFIFDSTLNLNDSTIFIHLKGQKTRLKDYATNEHRFFYHGSFKIEESIDSIFFVYKKDSTYYAYCRLLQAPALRCESFQVQCQFQDEGTPKFDPFIPVPYPYPMYYRHTDTCFTKEAFEKEITSIGNVQKGHSSKKQSSLLIYKLNGTPATGDATNIRIENGKPKVHLRN